MFVSMPPSPASISSPPKQPAQCLGANEISVSMEHLCPKSGWDFSCSWWLHIESCPQTKRLKGNTVLPQFWEHKQKGIIESSQNGFGWKNLPSPGPQPVQAAQSPIPHGLECLQGWGCCWGCLHKIKLCLTIWYSALPCRLWIRHSLPFSPYYCLIPRTAVELINNYLPKVD